MSGKSYQGYLDRFSILKNCVVIDGWATDCDPEVWYAGEKLPAVWKTIKRQDLAQLLGEHAEEWGFSLCAMLPSDIVDEKMFSFRFSAGMKMDNPCSVFSSANDAAFHAMWNSFITAVNEKRGSVLEIGSRDRSGNSYRGLFHNAQRYVGVDVTDGPGVDIVADAHDLSTYVKDAFDFAFSIAVFEHLLMPWKVALELNKVLKTGGRAMIISHAGWPLHEEPWDFWRYSKEAWQGIFNKHTGFRVIDAQYEFPARIIPDYTQDSNMSGMSHAQTFLLSGCVVERVGDSEVEWAGKTSDVYNLEYLHA